MWINTSNHKYYVKVIRQLKKEIGFVETYIKNRPKVMKGKTYYQIKCLNVDEKYVYVVYKNYFKRLSRPKKVSFLKKKNNLICRKCNIFPINNKFRCKTLLFNDSKSNIYYNNKYCKDCNCTSSKKKFYKLKKKFKRKQYLKNFQSLMINIKEI